MLTSAQFQTLCAAGPVLLDGATGSNLMKAGMPRGCCTEQWVLAHPEAIVALQRRYAEAGSKIPPFRRSPSLWPGWGWIGRRKLSTPIWQP